MHQGPYEHYAVPIAQGHCYQQLQAYLQLGVRNKLSSGSIDFLWMMVIIMTLTVRILLRFL